MYYSNSKSLPSTVPLIVMCNVKMDHVFTVQTAMRGFLIYQCIWDTANDGEIPCCEREVGNSDDPSAVTVKKGATTVAHISSKIFTICCIFL